jgi:hypothetical protein
MRQVSPFPGLSTVASYLTAGSLAPHGQRASAGHGLSTAPTRPVDLSTRPAVRLGAVSSPLGAGRLLNGPRTLAPKTGPVKAAGGALRRPIRVARGGGRRYGFPAPHRPATDRPIGGWISPAVPRNIR